MELSWLQGSLDSWGVYQIKARVRTKNGMKSIAATALYSNDKYTELGVTRRNMFGRDYYNDIFARRAAAAKGDDDAKVWKKLRPTLDSNSTKNYI